MISHLSLGTSDLARSTIFYDPILGALGFTRSGETKPGEAAYGPGGTSVFWLYDVGQGPDLASRGTHIAFTASSREQLHAAAASAADAGASFSREAGPHPDIAPDYYGAVFLDPDGHKLEIVVQVE